MEYIIEFRNGSYFQSLKHDNGGRKETAQVFKSKAKAESFVRKHEWMLFNGGIVVEKTHSITTTACPQCKHVFPRMERYCLLCGFPN